nr:MAG TPA: hypothetical protein [Caudoviricetes sp.]
MKFINLVPPDPFCPKGTMLPVGGSGYSAPE